MKPRRGEHTPETPWASFSDALSGMLFIFILTTFWYADQLAQQRRQVDDQLQTLRSADQKALDLVGTPAAPGDLTRCLGTNGTVAAILDPRPQVGEARVSLYLRSAVEWFAEGSAALGEEQSRGVYQIRRCLSELVQRDDLKDYRVSIFLEGHTDAIPLARGSAFATNWELSAARAAAVLNQLLPEDGESDPLLAPLRTREAMGEASIVAVGMADRQPAWSRLCESALPEEVSLCEALRAASNQSAAARNKAWGAALTEYKALFSEYTFDCTPPNPSSSIHEAPPPTAMDLLRAWANRCPRQVGADVREARVEAQARRALLRRVDLRLELDPIIDPAVL